ncbi:MAG: hypothetical protein EOM65_04930 [Synergistales bacterium]|nr:hypothetical protein [Synergistales bacterium]
MTPLGYMVLGISLALNVIILTYAIATVNHVKALCDEKVRDASERLSASIEMDDDALDGETLPSQEDMDRLSQPAIDRVMRKFVRNIREELEQQDRMFR